MPSDHLPRSDIPFRIRFVSLFCDDHVALSDYYRRAMGLVEIADLRSDIFVALDAGGTTLGFHADAAYDLLGLGDRRDRSGTAVHVTFAVDSDEQVADAAERLVAEGGTLVQGPFDTYYDARQIVVADPEGNVLRVTHQR
jgi:catechol 2,3-dioxygenase-like lactoylglutathione lyase family enzyme